MCLVNSSSSRIGDLEQVQLGPFDSSKLALGIQDLTSSNQFVFPWWFFLQTMQVLFIKQSIWWAVVWAGATWFFQTCPRKSRFTGFKSMFRTHYPRHTASHSSVSDQKKQILGISYFPWLNYSLQQMLHFGHCRLCNAECETLLMYGQKKGWKSWMQLSLKSRKLAKLQWNLRWMKFTSRFPYEWRHKQESS